VIKSTGAGILATFDGPGRLRHPLLEADKPPAPLEIRRALTTIERALNDYVTSARLGTAA
jgi:hypothetical protein